MKKLNQNIVFISSIMLLLLFSCVNKEKNETQNSTTKVEQKNTEIIPKIIFENEYSKVAKISLAPGESQSTHEGENRIIYSLSNYSIDWEEEGEELNSKTFKAGDVHFHEAGKHAAKNNGTTIAEWLVFTKKPKALPNCGDNTIENDVTSVSPDFAQTLFDNDHFKVTKVNLPKGDSISTHSGINRILYSLSNYNLNYQSNTEDQVDKQFKTGDTHWHEACMHSLKNNGDSNASYLLVSYK